MFGLDEALSRLGSGHGAATALVVAFLLGLRHAADPDHLVAISTLVAGTRSRATRAAARVGGAWGAGHATTMLAFGLPVLVAHAFLPAAVEASAEAAIGAIVVVLAARLLVQWRRGAFHLHVHEHGGSRHAHVHSHASTGAHAHAHALRSPRQAFSIGLVHGMAGSGGVAVLIVAAVPARALAALGLVVLAAGTALSMTALSAGFGWVLGAAPVRRALSAAVPALAAASCLFGVWYAAAALVSL